MSLFGNLRFRSLRWWDERRTVREPAPDPEIVLSVQQVGSGHMVVTRNSRGTYTYHGCIDTPRIGEVLAEPPQHRNRSASLCWSPFDTDAE